MDINIVDTLSKVDRDGFGRLSNPAGAAGCYSRLLVLEQNRLWRTRYLVAGSTNDPRCVVPVYFCNARTWENALYDPRRVSDGWTFAPRECLVVGGRSDLRAGLHTADDLDDRTLAQALGVLGDFAAETSRSLFFPYLAESDVRRLAAMDGFEQKWERVGREANFGDLLRVPENFSGLRSRVAGVLRRDLRILAEHQPRTVVLAWPDVADRAAAMVAEHNNEMGTDDSADLAMWRMEEWLSCDDVEVVVFASQADGADGVLVALRWADTLELSEIGLRGDRGPARHAVYLEMTVHGPLRYARERGLSSIRAGVHGETPKASRGASMTDLYFGSVRGR